MKTHRKSTGRMLASNHKQWLSPSKGARLKKKVREVRQVLL